MSAEIQSENWKAALTNLLNSLAELVKIGTQALKADMARKRQP